MFSYHFQCEEQIPSPALIYYRDLIEANTAEAIRIAGDAGRMWPHVKTHKMRQMIQMQMDMGIRRFKCATIAEMHLAAECGAEHILWAYPVIGPCVPQFLSLIPQYPNCTFYALEDDPDALRALSNAAATRGLCVNVLLDVNVGMNRTGIAPEAAEDFYRAAESLPGVRLLGLHCYDGQIHDPVFDDRLRHAAQTVNAAGEIRQRLLQKGFDAEILILGGTPTFPCHAGVADAFLSPGTIFVSDSGYHSAYPDIGATPAAAILTRVVSHPADGLFTLDCGYKALSADPNPRGVLVGFEDKCKPVLSSEEHWVFEMSPDYRDQRPPIGSVQYVIPTHVCPTTYLYDAAYVCSQGRLVDIWKVAARDRVGSVTLDEVLAYHG